MTKILSIEERVAEMPTNKCSVCNGDGYTVEHDPNDPTGQTPIQVQCDFCHAEGKITTLDCVRQTLTADRLTLLTELRDSGLLEEKEHESHKDDRSWCEICGHNTLAKKIKAYINNLINPTV